jgi:FKBP-type peptidyl-prolyl cis-trans isomerase FklB
MKKFIALPLCLVLLSVLAFAEDAKPAAPAPATAAAPEAKADLSYSLGMLFGTNIKTAGLKIEADAFLAGVMDVVNGKTLKYTSEEAQAAIQAALLAIQEKKIAENLAAGNAFLDGNKKKSGVKVTPSGLQYEVITLGQGPKPKADDTVKVNYEGKLLNGDIFDSSAERGEPAVFPLNGVIPGWTEGIQLMPVGSKYRLFVPANLAYGEKGAGNVIEPNSVLVFEVELISIEPKPAPESSSAPADKPAADTPAADPAKK